MIISRQSINQSKLAQKRYNVNKKTAMTLAEVLITLLIIGVVLVMTISTLINNIQDAQNKTALKENFSILSSTFKQLAYDNGGDIGNLIQSHSISASNILPYLRISASCENNTDCPDFLKINWTFLNGNSEHFGWYPTSYKSGSNTSTYITTLGLNNGAILNISRINPNLYSYTQSCYTSNITDVSINVHVFLDVNGQKGPNQFGKDVYLFYVLNNGKVVPAGAACSTDFSSSTCSKTNYGYACASVYLQE